MSKEIEIPSRLQDYQFTFRRLGKNSKSTIGSMTWNENSYRFDDEELLEHLRTGSSYGIVAGNGTQLRILDIDDPELFNADMPETFTVRTYKDTHRYYYSDYDENCNLYWSDDAGSKRQIGEWRADNLHVVAPNSIHEKGVKYEVVNDKPIVFIPKEKLLDKIGKYIVNKQSMKPKVKETTGSKQVDENYGEVSEETYNLSEIKKKLLENRKPVHFDPQQEHITVVKVLGKGYKIKKWKESHYAITPCKAYRYFHTTLKRELSSYSEPVEGNLQLCTSLQDAMELFMKEHNIKDNESFIVAIDRNGQKNFALHLIPDKEEIQYEDANVKVKRNMKLDKFVIGSRAELVLNTPVLKQNRIRITKDRMRQTGYFDSLIEKIKQGKEKELDHNGRRALGAYLIGKKKSRDEIHKLFRNFSDYSSKVTDTQLDSIEKYVACVA